MDNMLKDCKTYYGAIDIGSNAVRLLIKCVEEDEQGKVFFSKVLLLRVPLRLGFDVFAIGKISETKEKNMLRLMKVFHHLMKSTMWKTTVHVPPLPCVMQRTEKILSNASKRKRESALKSLTDRKKPR